MFRLVTFLIKKTKSGGSKIIEPAAWTYFDTVGKIWSQEAGSHFDAPSGQIALHIDTAPFQYGGAYFNRV